MTEEEWLHANVPEGRTFRQITRDVVNHTLPVNLDNLASWQLWYLKHIYCGGEYKLIQGRKRTSLICTCEFDTPSDEQKDREMRVKTGRITVNQARREQGLPEWDGVMPKEDNND